MSKFLKPADYSKLKVLESDANILLEIVTTLDILEEGISLLGRENYSSGSSVLPFLANFCDLLETEADDSDDPVYVSKFKTVLAEELITAGLNSGFYCRGGLKKLTTFFLKKLTNTK